MPVAKEIALGVAEPLFDLVDELFTSDDERAAAKLKLLSLDMKPVLGQLQVNMKEAENKNWFVAGWRPFIGWICGAIFAYNFILRDLAITVALLAGAPLPVALPVLDVAAIMPVLLGMLGLAGARTFEKLKGVESNRNGS